MKLFHSFTLFAACIVLACAGEPLFIKKSKLPPIAVTVPKVTVSGNILGRFDNQPLSDITLFIDGSSIGTITNNEGHFVLNKVPLGAFDLIILDESSKTYTHKLFLKKIEEHEVTIRLPITQRASVPDSSYGDTISLEKEDMNAYKLFGDVVMGEPETCRLLNPEALRYTIRTISHNKRIIYTADEPLLIDNLDLGYRITLFIKRINLESKRGRYSMQWDAVTHFSELNPVSDEQKIHWDKNRLSLFKGSLSHFINALATRRLSEEGFQVSTRQGADSRLTSSYISGGWKMESEFIPRQDPYFILFRTDNPLELEIYLDDFIQVTYIKGRAGKKTDYFPGISSTDQISVLTFPDGAVRFNLQGLQADYKRLMKSGYWGVKQICEMLPLEYTPEMHKAGDG